MATETQAIRENYELGVLAGEARREAEIISLLESYLGETDWSNFEGDSPSAEWIRGFSMALAAIRGEK